MQSRVLLPWQKYRRSQGAHKLRNFSSQTIAKLEMFTRLKLSTTKQYNTNSNYLGQKLLNKSQNFLSTMLPEIEITEQILSTKQI